MSTVFTVALLLEKLSTVVLYTVSFYGRLRGSSDFTSTLLALAVWAAFVLLQCLQALFIFPILTHDLLDTSLRFATAQACVLVYAILTIPAWLASICAGVKYLQSQIGDGTAIAANGGLNNLQAYSHVPKRAVSYGSASNGVSSFENMHEAQTSDDHAPKGYSHTENCLISAAASRDSSKHVLVLIPSYDEPAPKIIKAVKSVLQSHLPLGTRIHIFVAFDGEQEQPIYDRLLGFYSQWAKKEKPVNHSDSSSSTFTNKEFQITLSVFPRGGKRHTHGCAIELIKTHFPHYLANADSTFVFMLDSDAEVEKSSIARLLSTIEAAGRGAQQIQAVTGIIMITSVESGVSNLFEQVDFTHRQINYRQPEQFFSRITCLPGNNFFIRLPVLLTAMPLFTKDIPDDAPLHDYWQFELGEDRWLTYLAGRTDVSTTARVYTEAAGSFRPLLSQRRRWILGYLASEVFLWTQADVWTTMPFWTIFRILYHTIRPSYAQLLFIVFFFEGLSAEETTKISRLVTAMILMDWLSMLTSASRYGPHATIFYPVYVVVEPVFSWIRIIYTILTFARRGWIRPRSLLRPDRHHGT